MGGASALHPPHSATHQGLSWYQREPTAMTLNNAPSLLNRKIDELVDTLFLLAPVVVA